MNQKLTKGERDFMDNVIAGKLEKFIRGNPESDETIVENSSKIVDEMANYYNIKSSSTQKIADTWRLVDFLYLSDPEAPKYKRISYEDARNFASRYRNARYENEGIYLPNGGTV